MSNEQYLSKPEILIPPEGGGDPLPALNALSAVRSNAPYHELRDWRHPLGVYNISVDRICDKVGKCASKLEKYWTEADETTASREEIIDYLELSMYAAAEHVDDVERIANTFFRTDHDALKSSQVRRLKKAIKPLRDEVSHFTNTIKHSHGRLRLYEVDFVHNAETIALIGFFVEGFKDGGVAPHPILHAGGKTIISVTSFLWNILTYVGEMSVALEGFLRGIDAFEVHHEKVVDALNFRRTALKLARLPLYSFDDVHPFERVKWIVTTDNAMEELADSNIHGSILTPWSKSGDGEFRGSGFIMKGMERLVAFE